MSVSKKLVSVFAATLLLTSCAGYKKGSVGSGGAEAALNVDFERNAGDRVFFSFDSAALHHNSKAALEKQGRWLESHPNTKATLEGHCDERGTREYNLALGERRATAVKRFLVHHGIDSARLETVSYGKERPAVIGDDEKAYSQNRRTVTVIKE
jgi:peptidoglycan-associated lipoprotein